MVTLGLGGVAFGCRYGWPLQEPLSDSEARELLASARTLGITAIDTAAAYGESEARIGRLLRELAWEPRLVTKCSFVVDEYEPVSSALQRVRNSARRLGRTNVDTVLVHNESALSSRSLDRLAAQLHAVKATAIAARVGASVYDPDMLLAALDTISLDVVQLPLNVLDQRFADVIPLLKNAGIEVHARSLLLQGALSQTGVPSPPGLSSAVERFHYVRSRAGASIEAAALAPAIELHVDAVIVGARSTRDLRGFVRALDREAVPFDWRALAVKAEDLDPRRWPNVGAG